MPILDTKHKRKSAVITTAILAILIFIIYNYGMKYLDPPQEYGLAINFGNLDVGSGKPIKETKKITTPKTIKKQEVVEEVTEVLKQTNKEDMIVESTSKDVPVVKKIKEPKKDSPKIIKKKEPKSKPSKEIQDALTNLLKDNSSDEKPKGEGDDKKQGVKGKEKGDRNSSKYYGNGGNGGGNYNLAGRKALSKPIEKPNCQEEGIVVVRIQVDKNGMVVNAIPGVKGTTNSSACLLEPAKQAALRTRWNADGKAPSRQTGTIIYKFSLSR